MPEQTAEKTDAKPQITFEDFAKLDLRIATVTAAENHPNADRLLKLQVDDGSGTPRQICAGIKSHYSPEDMVGKQVIIVANLAPRELRGETSHGMLLAASDVAKGGEDRNLALVTPMNTIAPGSSVS